MEVSPPRQTNAVVHFRLPPDSHPPADLRALRREREEERGRGGGGGWRKRSGRSRRAGVHPSRLNFFVLRDGRRSFTVFPSSGDAIVTGVRDASQAAEALRRFSTEVLAAPPPRDPWREWSARVVNGTYSGTVSGGEGSPCQALDRYRRDPRPPPDLPPDEVTVSFRSQFFPGARVRRRGAGTINLFNNGKYVLVGVRDGESAERLRRTLCALMTTYWTTSARATRCAPTAD